MEPVLIAEIEFNTGVWTPVSSYLRSATTKRGKQRARDKIDVGNMVLTLRNEDRRFDPEHAGSPHAGKLLPGKRIRLRATWNAITYPIFTGWIDRIIQAYESPNAAIAIFDCTDGIARLAAAGLGTPFEVFMSTQILRTWLRLGEKSGLYAFDRSGNANHGVHWHGVPQYGVQGLVDRDSDGAVTFPVNPPTWMVLLPGTLPTVASWTISFLVKLPAPPASTQYLLYDIRFPQGLQIYFNPSGTLTAKVVTANGTTGATVTTSSVLANDNAYLVSIVATAGQALKIYVGDIDRSSGAAGTVHGLTSSYMVLGASPLQPTTLDELMVFDRALAEAELFQMKLAVGAWSSNDDVWLRVKRVLDAANWPVADRDISAAFDDYLAGTSLSTSALAHIQAIETTMEGRFWVTRAGIAKLLARNEHLVGAYAISQATFGDAADGSELGYQAMGEYGLDLDLVTNVVRRLNSGPYGETETIVEASNANSIASFGRRDQTDVAEVESLYQNLTREYDLAAFRLGHYAQPVSHVNGIRFEPRKDPARLWPQALGRELADRITFKRRPQGIGDPISKEVIIEGVSHTISPKSWVTEFAIDAIAARRYFRFDRTKWDDITEWRFSA